MNVTSILYDKIPLDIIRIAHYSFDKSAGQKFFYQSRYPKAPIVTRLKLEIVFELTIEFSLLNVCVLWFSAQTDVLSRQYVRMMFVFCENYSPPSCIEFHARF
jgi:hypothetical protein